MINSLPAGVANARLPMRSTSCRPQRFSNSRICWLIAGCVKCRRFAASVKLPSVDDFDQCAQLVEAEVPHDKPSLSKPSQLSTCLTRPLRRNKAEAQTGHNDPAALSRWECDPLRIRIRESGFWSADAGKERFTQPNSSRWLRTLLDQGGR